MIRKLRWKITGVTMLVAAVVLLAVFAGVYYFSQANIAESYTHQLRQAVQTGTADVRLPCFVAEVLPSGTVRISGSNYYDLEDGDALTQVVAEALSARADSGVLSKQHMRYYRQQGLLSVRIAFMDSTFEQATLRALVRICLLIGGGALLVLLGLSWLLSGFVTRPVARTWQNQQQFLSDASHELKTPLTVILSSADLLRRSAAPEQEAYIDNIQAESRRMRSLVEDMLTLFRAQKSAGALPDTTADVSEMAVTAALRFEPVAFEAGHLLEYDIAPGLSVRGDGARLGQALAVLLDNAVKYAAPGTPIQLDAARQGSRAVLTVTNRGEDIPADKLPHIFDRFYRADEARTDGSSFGLGLAIAKAIVDAHRGTIRCESGGGVTRFIISLPLAAGKQERGTDHV